MATVSRGPVAPAAPGNPDAAGIPNLKPSQGDIRPDKVMPYDEENKHLSYDEFVAKRHAMKKGDEAGDKARREEIAKERKQQEQNKRDAKLAEKENVEEEKKRKRNVARLEKLRKDLDKAEESLSKKPHNEKLEEKRDALKEEIEDIEREIA